MFLNGGSGKDKLTGGAGADTLYGLGGDDSLSGLVGEDVLAGNDGNDTLSGGANDDYLMGGLGADRIDGGTGNDWAGYEDATSAVKVDLALTTAQNTLGAGTDTLASIEYVHGSAYADTLMGTSGANYIFGGDGNDSLVGRAGDDFLAGGAGNDILDGGANDDTVSFDDGVAGGVSVSLITQTADGHGHDNLVSIESVYGSAYADTIVGDGGGNYLFGGDGDDMIWADGLGPNGLPPVSGGEDVLDGGAGDDRFTPGQSANIIIDGGAGVDLVDFVTGAGPQTHGVKVDLADNGPQMIDANRIMTLTAVESVVGTESNDTISAGLDKNLLFGYAGNDTYIFRSLGELGLGDDADTVAIGWDSDTIDLSAIDADTTVAGNQAFHSFNLYFGQQSTPLTQFTGHAGEITFNYDIEKSMYLMEFDVNGDAVADASLWVQWLGVGPTSFVL